MDSISDVLDGKWSPLDPLHFINENRRSADVIWLGRVLQTQGTFYGLVTNDDLTSLIKVLGLETRQYNCNNPNECNSILSSCHTVRFKDGKKWQDENAGNYYLDEWTRSEDYKSDPKVRKLELKDGKLEEDVITTAYNPQTNTRIIISGLHRAAALYKKIMEKDRTIPSFRIFECSGSRIGWLFPCDFSHF